MEGFRCRPACRAHEIRQRIHFADLCVYKKTKTLSSSTKKKCLRFFFVYIAFKVLAYDFVHFHFNADITEYTQVVFVFGGKAQPTRI